MQFYGYHNTVASARAGEYGKVIRRQVKDRATDKVRWAVDKKTSIACANNP